MAAVTQTIHRTRGSGPAPAWRRRVVRLTGGLAAAAAAYVGVSLGAPLVVERGLGSGGPVRPRAKARG